MWIEIRLLALICRIVLSRPARALWIEITTVPFPAGVKMSRPARALWIEMLFAWNLQPSLLLVEAREGLVD